MGKMIAPALKNLIIKAKDQEAEKRAAEASSIKKVDTKLPMSKRRTRNLQNQSQLNNQTTLLGG